MHTKKKFLRNTPPLPRSIDLWTHRPARTPVIFDCLLIITSCLLRAPRPPGPLLTSYIHFCPLTPVRKLSALVGCSPPCSLSTLLERLWHRISLHVHSFPYTFWRFPLSLVAPGRPPSYCLQHSSPPRPHIHFASLRIFHHCS